MKLKTQTHKTAITLKSRPIVWSDIKPYEVFMWGSDNLSNLAHRKMCSTLYQPIACITVTVPWHFGDQDNNLRVLRGGEVIDSIEDEAYEQVPLTVRDLKRGDAFRYTSEGYVCSIHCLRFYRGGGAYVYADGTVIDDVYDMDDEVIRYTLEPDDVG